MACITDTSDLNCVITVSITGKIEVDEGCGVYSIGNQSVSASVSQTETCAGTCTPLINGEEVPVDVCDGDAIVVTLSGCQNEFKGTRCGSASLRATNFIRPTQNNSLRISSKQIGMQILQMQKQQKQRSKYYRGIQ